MYSVFKSFCRRVLPGACLIFLVGAAVYYNSIRAPFVLDDFSSIVDNIAIKKIGHVFYGYKLGLPFIQKRFIAYLSIAINHHFGGLNVIGYHLVNIFIHLATSILVYVLLRLTFRTPYFHGTDYYFDTKNSKLIAEKPLLAPPCFIPLFAALLFLLHPAQSQGVIYIVQRMTSLATFFYLLSLVFYAAARLRMGDLGLQRQDSGLEHSKRKTSFLPIFSLYGGSVLAAVLAMKTKEIAFTLPLAISLYEIFFFQGPLKRRIVYLLPVLATLPIIPLSIMGIGEPSGVGEYARVTVASPEEHLRAGTAMSRVDYLFTQFRVIVTYVRLLFWPVNQNLDYDYPVFKTFSDPAVFWSFLLLASIFAFGVFLFFASRRILGEQGQDTRLGFRFISFGILWFFLALSVESSLVPIKDVIMEHRLYLPFFGAVSAFSMAFYLLGRKLVTGPSRERVMLSSAAVLLLLLGAATCLRVHVWEDPVRLWQDVVEKSPNKARPVNNLGKALEEAGKRNEAIQAFTKAIKLDPGYYKAYYNLGYLYLVNDQPEMALQLLQAAIRLNPGFTEAYVGAGAALMRSGRFRDVAIFLEQNLDRIAEKAEARFYLGAAYAFLGNREGALRELEFLKRVDPSYASNLAGLMGLNQKEAGPHGHR